ncbi:MAG: Rrf2 family transcriptional regulator [Clostridia bacterium]|nr:Rrf2 family transcriptional regulator [Clostridia bacterium]
MRISTKGRYALRVLVYLAENLNGNYIALKEIAKSQHISKKYLEQIVPVLTRNGLLQVNRGFQGGYRLSRNPDKFTVGSVLRMTEGSLSSEGNNESGFANSEYDEDGEILFVWQGLNKTINTYLDSITIQDIIDNKQDEYVNDYVI